MDPLHQTVMDELYATYSECLKVYGRTHSVTPEITSLPHLAAPVIRIALSTGNPRVQLEAWRIIEALDVEGSNITTGGWDALAAATTAAIKENTQTNYIKDLQHDDIRDQLRGFDEELNIKHEVFAGYNIPPEQALSCAEVRTKFDPLFDRILKGSDTDLLLKLYASADFAFNMDFLSGPAKDPQHKPEQTEFRDYLGVLTGAVADRIEALSDKDRKPTLPLGVRTASQPKPAPGA